MSDASIRWCNRGDTISTTQPMHGDGSYLHARCVTAESCAMAQELILAGRWRVSRCGRCDELVEQCRCEV
jgi:hypothetical protein